MIQVISYVDALTNQYYSTIGNFRYNTFYENAGWRDGLNIREIRGKLIEEDEFDNLNTLYLLSHSSVNNNITGVTRFNPTTSPYMLEKFNHLVEQDLTYSPLPKLMNTWEATRTGFSSDLSNTEKITTSNEMVKAFFELSIALDAENVVGMMRTATIRFLFGRAGCLIDCENGDMEYLGDAFDYPDPITNQIDKSMVAANLKITPEGLNRVSEKTGLLEPILYTNCENEHTRELLPEILLSDQLTELER